MSGFKFCFSPEDKESEEIFEDSELNWMKSQELFPTPEQISDIETIIKHAKIFFCAKFEISYVIADNIISSLKETNETDLNTLEAEKQHSDLIAGKYEGGLKIWECTTDLAEYVCGNIEPVNMKSLRVLDLGCGSGILGIIALLSGAASVHFQDYNKEVITNFTIPNVLLNIDEDKKQSGIINSCQFFSGDWKSFQENNWFQNKYDLILTSETIYNAENYSKLCSIFKNMLTKDGYVLLAAKKYYFGVGGSIRQFELCLKENGLKYTTVWDNYSGIKREIIKITL